MPRALTKCPNCGQPVSQFAAGCAICGENLVAARRKLEERNAARERFRVPRPSWVSEMTGPELFLAAVLIVGAIMLPVVMVFVSGFIAFLAHRGDQTLVRNVALASIAVSIVVLLLVSFVPGTWDELLPWVDLSGPLTE